MPAAPYCSTSAAGIPAVRVAGFHECELLLPTAAFFLLGVLAFYRRSRILAGVCCCLALLCAGALTATIHAPGPPPRAGLRETAP